MYISKIEIKKIRCFEHLIIDIKGEENLNMWLTILGDNAVGKSTLLKCLAMGLMDQSSAAALMKEDKAEFIRRGETSGEIKIDLIDNNSNIYSVITSITKDSLKSPELISQSFPDEVSLWQDVFMCGYGVQIGDAGGDTWESYRPLEAVYTLFNTGSELQNTEAIMFKQSERPKLRKKLSEKLKEILLLKDYDDFEYDTKGMYVFGPWGKSRVNELSDGYRRIIQIIVDFFGWQVVADRLESVEDKIVGVILIDELETHLHPRLQRFIVDKLRIHLPYVQIITTTHSPLIALGTSDLDNSLIVELDLEDNLSNKVKYKIVNPQKYKGFTVDQILTSTAFDMPIARSAKIGDKMLRFRELFLLDNLDEKLQKEYKQLKKELDEEIPEAGELEEDRKIQREVLEMLKEINEEINDSTKGKTPMSS